MALLADSIWSAAYLAIWVVALVELERPGPRRGGAQDARYKRAGRRLLALPAGALIAMLIPTMELVAVVLLPAFALLVAIAFLGIYLRDTDWPTSQGWLLLVAGVGWIPWAWYEMAGRYGA